jgi:hypothetical protein
VILRAEHWVSLDISFQTPGVQSEELQAKFIRLANFQENATASS